jgi:CHAT domain-containing protein
LRHSALLVLVVLAGCSPPQDAIRRELAHKLGPARPVEGRLIGGFIYRPFEPGLAVDLAASGRTVLRSLNAYPEERPLVDLFKHQAAPAVEGLEDLVARRPGDAGIWSDFSAAYLARAVEEPPTPLDLARALEAALHALEIKPKLVEARFNAALAFEHLGLTREARAAWNEVLAIEPSSGWAGEAENHLERLSRTEGLVSWRQSRSLLDRALRAHDAGAIQELASHFRQPLRQLVEETLLPEWGSAWVAGRFDEASFKLGQARLLAAGLAVANGDRMAADTIAAIDGSEGERLALLARGHAEIGEAFPELAAHRLEGACPRFRTARTLLDQAGSPFAGWATAHLVTCEIERQEFAAALQHAIEAQRLLDRGRHPSLAARLAWSAGLASIALGDPDSALVSDREALSQFEALGEEENTAQLRTILAEALRFLGEQDSAWQNRARALLKLAWLTPRRRSSVLGEASHALAAEGLPRAALAMREAALREAERVGGSASPAFGHLKRAECLLALNRVREAQTDLDRATEVVRSVEDESLRGRIEADIAIARSRLPIGPPATAVAQLSRALEYYNQRENHYPKVALLLARGRAFLESGDQLRALEDFRSGIREVEDIRARLLATGKSHEDPYRLTYFALSIELFEEAISLLDKRRDALGALDLAEQARARVMFDRLSAEESANADLVPAERIMKFLPSDVALVEYVSLKDRLLIWLLRSSGISAFAVPIPQAALAGEIDRFLLSIEAQDQDRARRSGEALYRMLIQPFTGSLDPNDRLITISDPALPSVPYAALRNPSSKKYLVEEHALGNAPSANVFLRCQTRASQLGPVSPRGFLIVGEPYLDSAAFPRASPLPMARREAEALAAKLPGSTFLAGREASRTAVLAALPRASGFHFAGHSFLSPRYPLFSRLALASGDGHGGSILAGEIDDLPLRKLRLVVLSSCEAGIGPSFGNEGTLSLARPFLVAGVPQVVATLWSVSDRGAKDLVATFYDRILRGSDPIDALRLAQVKCVRTADRDSLDPRSWAAFTLFGGT